jgi:hypothetical protein
MAFWSEALSEPKRQHRFLLQMPMLGVDRENNNEPKSAYVQYLAKTVSKPAYTLGVTEHKFLGNTFHYPGAVTWDEVSATIVNSVEPNGDEMLYRALYQAGYYDPSDQSAYFLDNTGKPGTPNKAFSQRALGLVEIIELNGAGEQIDSWLLNNAFITNVKFGDLDYSGEELLNVEMTFRYDWATFKTTGNGQMGLDDTRGAPDVFNRGIA